MAYPMILNVTGTERDLTHPNQFQGVLSAMYNISVFLKSSAPYNQLHYIDFL